MKDKIRIAYLIDTLSSDKAGTEKQLLNIINRLDRDQFEVSLVCLYDSPWMVSNKLPCEVFSLGYAGFMKPDFPIVLWKYMQILRANKFDIVQVFFEDSVFIGCLGKLLSRNKHSLIISRRDMGLGIDEPGYHKYYKKIMPLVARYADGMATNAKIIRSNIIEHLKISREKVSVIANGLDLPPPLREPPPLFSENRADIWVGIVANLKPVKRIDLFLQALAYLKINGGIKKVRAVVLGDGQLRHDLVRLATDLGVADRVHFMGAMGNVNEYLQCIDVGVICSDKEGLPNAILEYMACGLPVIATRVGGNCELVDETNGMCVPAGNYAAIGSALTRLISSEALRKQLGERSLQKIKDNYLWEKIMPQWESYYCSLISS